MFKFVFLNIILGMGKPKAQVETPAITKKIDAKTLDSEEINNDNLFKIIDGHYIVKTHKGLKKLKISDTDKKNINDEIKIEKL